jgi:hypothetical protein
LQKFRADLVTKLMQVGRSNPSLYYRPLKTTLELPPLGSPLIANLAGGSPIRSAELRGLRQSSEATTPEGDADEFEAAEPDHIRRLRAIRAKAREHLEERGLDTLYAGLGLLAWKADDGGRDPLALLLFLPVEIAEDPRRRGEYVLKKVDDGELSFNPSLLEVIPAGLRDRLAQIAASPAMDDLASAIAAASQAIREVGGFTLQQRCVLGTFAFASLALVEDLKASDDLLESSLLAKALAGDVDAQMQL